jgi:hypothetical protein
MDVLGANRLQRVVCSLPTPTLRACRFPSTNLRLKNPDVHNAILRWRPNRRSDSIADRQLGD